MAEKRKRMRFRDDPECSSVLSRWWQGLEHQRGERAALRRVGRPVEVAFSPVYHSLYYGLREKGFNVNRSALEAVAGLASHVRHDTGNRRSLAQEMAVSEGGKARVSSLRFRRMLLMEEREELYSTLVRIIRMLGGSVNLASLADSVYWWGDNVRKQWAYEYYSVAPREEK